MRQFVLLMNMSCLDFIRNTVMILPCKCHFQQKIELQRITLKTSKWMIDSSSIRKSALSIQASGCLTRLSSLCTRTGAAHIQIDRFLVSKMDEGILITVGGNGSRMTVPCQGKQVNYFARISDVVNILKDDIQFSCLTCYM